MAATSVFLLCWRSTAAKVEILSPFAPHSTAISRRFPPCLSLRLPHRPHAHTRTAASPQFSRPSRRAYPLDAWLGFAHRFPSAMASDSTSRPHLTKTSRCGHVPACRRARFRVCHPDRGTSPRWGAHRAHFHAPCRALHPVLWCSPGVFRP